jgi:hypothetical protein
MYLRKILPPFLFVMLTFASVIASPSQASARHHHRPQHTQLHHGVDARDRYFCHVASCRREMVLAHLRRHGRTRTASFIRRHREPNSAAGIHGQLEAKAHEIVSNCGSTIISEFRRGARIAGSGHASMHASGRAVDIKGNPKCIYSHLQGWPGGYSVDYGSVQHVHISLGGFEDGVRFSHHGSHHRSG